MNGIPQRRGDIRAGAYIVWALAAFGIAPVAVSAQQELNRTRDRGQGVPVSMFGTYIDRGQLLIYPFIEYYRDHDAEYSPQELGYGLDQDFRGRYRALEGLIFVAFGISDRIAVEVEAAVITAKLNKSPFDPTSTPAVIEESGIGDVEGQLRWRWGRETASRPEIFSYFETVFPLQKNRRLIGTQDWEFKLGTGAIRGFAWGTMTVRLAAEYDGAENVVEAGEFAVEYLKRISPRLLVFLAVEGSQDEIETIPEVQWALRRNIVLKFNSAFGVTSKAADWAPELGILFSLR